MGCSSAIFVEIVLTPSRSVLALSDAVIFQLGNVTNQVQFMIQKHLVKMWTSPTNCNSPPVGVFELRNPHQRAIRVCAEAIITSEDLWLSSPLSRGKKGHERQLLLIQALRYPRGNVAVTEVEEGGSGGGGSSTNFTSEQLELN
uniref:Uncharacterized protein n=1 Tax=Mesocestoides corti TaxID=53468 RepID=A0A5K3FER1_MESCO